MDRCKSRARKKLRHGESQKREDAGARKSRKVAKHSVFPIICGSGGSKSRLAKAAGVEPAGQMRDEKNCSPLWREAHLEVKSAKSCRSPRIFKSWGVEKVQAVVAQTLFGNWYIKKVHARRETYFEVKIIKILFFNVAYGHPDIVLMSKKIYAVAVRNIFKIKKY